MWSISLVNREFWKENFQIHLWIFMVDQTLRKRQKSVDQAPRQLHLQRLLWSAIQIKNMIFNCIIWFIWYDSYHMTHISAFLLSKFISTVTPSLFHKHFYPQTPQLLVQSDKSFYLKWRPTSCAETQKYFTYNVLFWKFHIKDINKPMYRLYFQSRFNWQFNRGFTENLKGIA